MPLLKASVKDVRKTKKRTARNLAQDSMIKTLVKKVRGAKTAAEAKKAFEAAVPVLDKAVIKKQIHKNKANRLKSRLATVVAKISASPAAAK